MQYIMGVNCCDIQAIPAELDEGVRMVGNAVAEYLLGAVTNTPHDNAFS
jgi:hypothetical protein